jgi:hypothetical protein
MSEYMEQLGGKLDGAIATLAAEAALRAANT